MGGGGDLACAQHLAVSRGLSADPEDVIITGGTSDALHLIVAMLRSQADHPRILVEDPGYPTARRVMRAAGAQLLSVPVDENGMRSSQLGGPEGDTRRGPHHAQPPVPAGGQDGCSGAAGPAEMGS
ncbi:aminotransferase class I/II-fold pyridoxal phosphate-dependent enzyme [Arthrobacter sp. UYEF36]|uniref:aminotransferase class I/II-fold pyridoxal phosphate-dependent enzyme n=1 Tax=Arthrobacter sp. UYEF36 TaxID=1756366 RepID=UPI003391926E